jgi:hypothetical protein
MLFGECEGHVTYPEILVDVHLGRKSVPADELEEEIVVLCRYGRNIPLVEK